MIAIHEISARDLRRLSDTEFKEHYLDRVLAEARRRNFTVKLDPFNVLGGPKSDSPDPWVARG